MDPLTILSLTSAAMALLKEAIPQVREMFANGEITKEQQEKVLAEYNSLKERAESQFSGPEWEQSGRED
jgi:hypothetical protein